MKIEFSGAAGCVTGSSHLLRIEDKLVLLDCGLYQGNDEKQRGNDTFPFDPSELDFLVLSHTHIDHSGRIPMLYKQGFRGRIIATPPSVKFCQVLLLDSAKIQEQDAERDNKKRQRSGEPSIEPLYSAEDAEAVMEYFEELDFHKELQLFPGCKIRFVVAGHILGAAFTEIFVKESGMEKEIKFVYSGDIGNINLPLIEDPEHVEDADYLIMETTYGDRLHPETTEEHNTLISIINDTVSKGGNVVIPAFAVGRTQEIIYLLNDYAEKGILANGIKVYVDSPLASKATQIFEKSLKYLDAEAQTFIRTGDDIFAFPELIFTDTTEESISINSVKQGAVIISASGMANSGRVRHHLKHNLWRPECAVVFVGYNAEGTLGREIQEGAKRVQILGEDISVQASVFSLGGLSGHADQAGLFNWLKGFKKNPKTVFLVHGESNAMEAFNSLIEKNGYNAKSVANGETVDLALR